MSFSDHDIENWLSLMRRASTQEILPRFRKITQDDISTKKNATDVVTEADVNAELFLIAELSRLYPNALVFGEESYARSPGVIDGLKTAELAFVIDPVDGTLNFVKGLPVFGTILSVVRQGKTIAGIIYDPINDNALAAIKGAGAYEIRANGERSQVRAAEPKALYDMSASFCWMFFPEPQRSKIASNLTMLSGFHGLNCSVYDYWLASTGAVDFTFNYCGQYWDHLAGVLIHEEAGGYNAHFDGTPYDAIGHPSNILSAPDKESWEMINSKFLP